MSDVEDVDALRDRLRAGGDRADVLAEEVRAVRQLTAAAREGQWDTPPRRSSGVGRSLDVSDPTADVATDGQRLALREAYLQGELALSNAAVGLRYARLALLRALEPYDG